MSGIMINPNDRTLVSVITLESGHIVFYKDKTINNLYKRVLEVE